MLLCCIPSQLLTQGAVILHDALQLIKELGRLSTFIQDEPTYYVLMPLLLSVFETYIIVSLACQSIGINCLQKKYYITGTCLGMFIVIARLIIPVPYNVLINFILLVILLIVLENIPITRSLIGTSFAMSVMLVGSVLISEPIFLLTSHGFGSFLLRSSFGFSIGVFMESLLPLITLIVFKKYNITLISHNIDPGSESKNENTKV